MKKDLCLLILTILFLAGCTETTKDEPETSNIHTVAFRITSTTTSSLTGVAISYDITDGTRVRDLFVKCSSMPWQSSTYNNIKSGNGVGLSILVNNGPSYGGNGNLTISILVDNAVWKSSTITMTTGASASLGGNI